MSIMDELEKKAQKGLEQFKAEDGKMDFQSMLDGRIDDMLGEPTGGGSDNTTTASSTSSKKGNNNIMWALLIGIGLGSIGYMGYKAASTEKSKPVPAVKNESPRVLFAQYFEPLEDLNGSAERGASPEDAEKKSLGMMYYNKKNYKKAAATLLAAGDVDSQFYGAVSLLASGDGKSASGLLNRMSSDASYDKYKDLIQWYHGLALIESNQLSKARSIFKSIADGGGYKSKESKDILKRI